MYTTLHASMEGDRSRSQRLAWTLRGSYRHYLRLGEADRLFGDSSIAYRYAPSRSILIGLIQTVTYARLQLLDTEGNTLPRKLFASYLGEARAYSQWLAGNVRTTVAAGLRRQDVNETALETASGTVIFASLDRLGYFIGIDLGYHRRRTTAGLNYEYAVTHYDELRASYRNGSTSLANPHLSLIQHTVRAEVAGSPLAWGRLGVEGQFRWTVDPFENELTSRQVDAKAQTEIALPFTARWVQGVGHRARIYAERLLANGDPREERFLFVDTVIEKAWTASLSSSAQYQYLQKATRVPNDEFRAAIYSVGISYTF